MAHHPKQFSLVQSVTVRPSVQELNISSYGRMVVVNHLTISTTVITTGIIYHVDPLHHGKLFTLPLILAQKN